MAFNREELSIAIDVGNTNITMGIYKDNKLSGVFRKTSDVDINQNRFSQFLEDSLKSIGSSPEKVKSAILASVVLPLNNVIIDSIQKLTGKNCHSLDFRKIPKIRVALDSPEKVGIDRLVNIYEVYETYGVPALVIDMGTATTFDVVTGDGTFVGGAISPGMKLSYEALIKKTDQLPEIDFIASKSVIGKNTEQSIQSGTIFGYAGLIDSMAAKISQEIGTPLKIIATGGLVNFIRPYSSSIDIVMNDLTISGLYRLLNYHENKPV